MKAHPEQIVSGCQAEECAMQASPPLLGPVLRLITGVDIGADDGGTPIARTIKVA